MLTLVRGHHGKKILIGEHTLGDDDTLYKITVYTSLVVFEMRL